MTKWEARLWLLGSEFGLVFRICDGKEDVRLVSYRMSWRSDVGRYDYLLSSRHWRKLTKTSLSRDAAREERCTIRCKKPIVHLQRQNGLQDNRSALSGV